MLGAVEEVDRCGDLLLDAGRHGPHVAGLAGPIELRAGRRAVALVPGLGPRVAVELVGERRARLGRRSLPPAAQASEQRAPALRGGSPVVICRDRSLANPALVDRALLAELAHGPPRAAVQIDLRLLATEQRATANVAGG